MDAPHIVLYCLVIGMCECINVCAYSYSVYCIVPGFLTLTVTYYLRACDELGGGLEALGAVEVGQQYVLCLLFIILMYVLYWDPLENEMLHLKGLS